MKYENRTPGFKNKYDRLWQTNRNKSSKHLSLSVKALKNGDVDSFKKEFAISNYYQDQARIALHKRIYAQYRSEKRTDSKQ